MIRSKLRDENSDCIKSWTVAVLRWKSAKGKEILKEFLSPFYYKRQGNKSCFHLSFSQWQALLNWPAAIISTASCTAATLLGWLNVTRFWPVGKKNIQQTKKKKGGEGSKSHIKRHHLGEQTDIFGEKSYKLLLGEKHKQ